MDNTSRLAIFAAAFALSIVPSITSPSARANMASPQFDGDSVGAPFMSAPASGADLSSADIDVLGETLTIDFRRIDRDRAVDIEAVYQLDNPGAPGRLDLVFVAPSARAISVELDGQLLTAEPVDLTLPDTWQPPDRTPRSDRTGTLEYGARSSGTFRFAADLPTGNAAIAVRYTVVPGTYDAGVYRDYQIGYVLAPIRDWRSFGNLDLIVRIPDGWQLGSSALVTGEGNELRGEFEALPDDTLGLAASPRRSGLRYLLTVHSRTVGWWIGLVGAAIAARTVGRLVRRRIGVRKMNGDKVAIALLGAAAGLAVFVLGYGGGLELSRRARIGHEAGNWDYGYAISSLIWAMGGAAIALPTTIAAALLAPGPKASDRLDERN
ncbi:MAG: hypothetical protein ACFB9N_13575 [Geitlerinemataceae cyanobacterium]